MVIESYNELRLSFLNIGSAIKSRYFPGHRRRKILKIGGAQYTIARVARAKNFRPRPLMVKTRPFLHDRSYCDHAAKSFLMKERIVSQIE